MTTDLAIYCIVSSIKASNSINVKQSPYSRIQPQYSTFQSSDFFVPSESESTVHHTQRVTASAAKNYQAVGCVVVWFPDGRRC